MENNPIFTHSAFNSLVPLLDLLAEGASADVETVHKKYSRAKRTRRGQTLRAGAGTPLWNTLVGMLNAQCKNHGDKAKLARYLGLPRQRMNDFLNGYGSLPDAERTLLLLQWLVARHQSGSEKQTPNSKKSD